jgi:polyisoprenoid-binding protein YceI
MPVRLGLLLSALAIFAAACASTPTSAPTQAELATLAPPQPTTAPAPTDAPASEPGSGMPATLADAEGKTYAFQVVPAETTVEYAVNEILFGNPQITRGKTSTVEGDFKLGFKDGKPVVDVNKLRVDLRTLKSDNGIRDAAIQRQWLESAKYPYADFVVTDIKNFPAAVTAGQEAKFQVTGNMTIREITKPITFDVTIKLDRDKLVGTGTAQIYMKDFGFDPPQMLGRFIVSDPATITITGVAQYTPEGS